MIINFRQDEMAKNVCFPSYSMENHTMHAHGIKQLQKALGVLLKLMIKEFMLKTWVNGEFVEKDVKSNVSEIICKFFQNKKFLILL